VFRGNKEVTAKQVQEMLGLSSNVAPGGRPAGPPTKNRFLMPLAECQLNLESILEELQRDSQHSKGRMLRATGVAAAVAIGLLEASCPGSGARVMLFAAGPPTTAPGQVLSEDPKELIRSHNDIAKDKAPMVSKSTKYYDSLGRRAAANGHTIDLFFGALDQVGLLEMRGLVKHTGELHAVFYFAPGSRNSAKMLLPSRPRRLACDGGKLPARSVQGLVQEVLWHGREWRAE
jgi:protein transport protein SEC23